MKGYFPFFRKNKEIAYLDNAAMTQKPEVAILAMDRFYKEYCANAHRGVYPIAEKVTEEFESARAKVGNFIGANAAQIVFTRNVTEAINILAHGLKLGKKPKILVTEAEHHSNLVPWQKLVERSSGELRFISVSVDGKLDLSQLDKLLDGVGVVSLTWVSNVLGIINPVKEIIKRVKEHGAVVVIDAAQFVPHFRVNVSSLGADAIAFSGYKIGGPTGVGILWAKKELLDALEPLNYGGHMVSQVEYNKAEFKDAPWKFEAGTQDIAAVIGMGETVDFLNRQDWGALEKKAKELRGYMMEGLKQIKGLRIFGSTHAKDRIGLVSFNLDGVHPHDVATVLGEEGVCVRAGHHCVQPLHKKFGFMGSVRASLWWYNSVSDIDRLIHALGKVKEIFS